ncbi:peptide-binding protein [[Phormidium ambiguum] IAM M-71]|uniref:Peptide-binding protein n=1 Tax=[Phormidium ambiguum] IAM M-71 TaxID=454136 RepID=A0A1U7IJ21_9CYAN|nr:FHA domain-containing protein [Phormidium ambiguum]OKH37098.1 peptide-binding protein [Phormidium ambiguum IAM M-71]
MNEITFEWQEAGHIRKVVIRDQQLSKNPGTVRLGRDPVKSDIVLTHPTVSGLHVEIFFNPSCYCFQVRNLRQSNPPVVDGKILIQGEMTLVQGSTICLGQTEIKVVAVSLAGSSVPPTILMPPQPGSPGNQIYGLKCPKCDRISPFERLDLGCPWCGTSLAAASSVLMSPNTH